MKKSVITTEKIKEILEEFAYYANPVMFDLFGEYVWVPTQEPIDLSLPLKTIKMSELIPIRTETQLRTLIKSKLGGFHYNN